MNGKRQYAAACATNRAAKHAKLDAGSGREDTTEFNELAHNVGQGGFEPKGVSDILGLVEHYNADIGEVSLIDKIMGHKDYRKIINMMDINMMDMWEVDGPPEEESPLYASKEDEEIGGHFVPDEGCGAAKRKSPKELGVTVPARSRVEVLEEAEEAGSSAEAGGAKAAAE